MQFTRRYDLHRHICGQQRSVFKIPAGVYNNGILKIYDYMYKGSPAFTYSKKFANSYDGYFFIKHVPTNKIYAMNLKQKNPSLYVVEDVIGL